MASRLRGKSESKQLAREPDNQPDKAQADEDLKNCHAHRQGPRGHTSPAKGLLAYEKRGGSPGTVAYEQRECGDDNPDIHAEREQGRE